MDIRKKILSVVGVLALTMSMSAGIALAQEDPPSSTSGGIDVRFEVVCSAKNTINSATIGSTDTGATEVAFPTYNPSEPGDGTISTLTDFRVTINLTPGCVPENWHVTASIGNFAEVDEPLLTIPGSAFQLTHDGGVWTTDGVAEADNVTEPASPVSFTGGPTSYTSAPLAVSSGLVTDASMYMDFTGKLVGLDELTIQDGDYLATVMVTFTPTAP